MTFNEYTSLRVQVKWRNGSTPISPNTVHYKLMNLTTDTVIVDWTSVPPSADVTVDLDAQLLVAESRRLEEFEMTFAADKDTDNQVTEARSWKVANRRAFGN